MRNAGTFDNKPKVLYHQVTTPPYIVGSFDCTLYMIYHVPPELWFLSYLKQYLLRYPGFSYYYDTWTSFIFSIVVLWVALVAFSGNNASPFWICVLFIQAVVAISRTTSAARHAHQNENRGSTRAGTNALTVAQLQPPKK